MKQDYVNSYYSQSRAAGDFPELNESVDCDICVIGGGLAGLNTALGIAIDGKNVTVIEANKIAWGASGRNGGFVSSGYTLGNDTLEKKLGLSHTKELYDLSLSSVQMVRERIEKYDLACQVTDGLVLSHLWDESKTCPNELEAHNKKYGESLEFWDKKKTQAHYKTEFYKGASYDPGAFHFHCLNYALGIAKAAEEAGAKIFEGSPAIAIDEHGDRIVVSTPQGKITANQIVLACSGYIKHLYPKMGRATLPITTYVMVTEPLGDRLKDVTDLAHAVTDHRMACDYWRPLPDGSTRILWGGRITAFPAHPNNVATIMQKCMLRVFPQLSDVKIETAWSGVMGYARHRMPMIGKLKENVWYNTGFGGHGMAATTLGGEVISKAISQQDETYKLFEPFGLPYAGSVFGPLAAQSYYVMQYLKDEYKIRKG